MGRILIITLEDLMKKILILLLIAAILPCLAFAKGEQEEAMPEKLVYLTASWGAPSQELLDKFENETGIKVEVSSLKESDLRNKVMTAAAGKTSPADVIFTGISNFGVFGHSGILKPLNDFVEQSTFDSVMGQQFFQIAGETYCVPMYQQMVMIDYDKAALEQIGLKGSDIKTWDDFENAALKLKSEGIMEYPLAFAVRHWSWYLMALSQGSTLFDADGNPTFNDPSDPGYKAFIQLIRYFEEGLISPERLTSPNAHPSFWAGQAAFHQAWQGSLAIANNPEKSKIAPNADYLLQPEQHYTWSLPAGLGISAYTEYPKASLMFIEFLISEEVQRFGYEANGMFPALISLFNDLGNSGQIEGWEVMAEQAEYLVPLPYNTPWFAEFETELKEVLVSVARKEIGAEQAIADLAAFQQELKKEYE